MPNKKTAFDVTTKFTKYKKETQIRFELSGEQTLRLEELRNNLAENLPANANEMFQFPATQYAGCGAVCMSGCTAGCRSSCKSSCAINCAVTCGFTCAVRCGGGQMG